MFRTIATICAVLLALAGINAPAMADVTMAVTFSGGTDVPTGWYAMSEWPDDYQADTKLGQLIGTDANGWRATAENNWQAGTTAGIYALGQSWTATSSGYLRDIQIFVGGGNTDFNVAIYEVNSAADMTDAAGASYIPSSVNASSDLLTGTRSFTSTATSGGKCLKFTFTGADAIALTEGNVYIFEIWSAADINTMFWVRELHYTNNVLDTYPLNAYTAGMAFRAGNDPGAASGGRGLLNGNTQRDMALAVNEVLHKASSPSPADDAEEVSLTPLLSWTAGYVAQSHDVYLGTDFNDVNDANTSDLTGIYLDTTTDASYQIASALTGDIEYYWRVDEVNDTNTWKGDVWSFTTSASKASNPNPANGATGISQTPLLAWTAGQAAADANGHEVYLGTDFNDVNDANNTDITGIYLGNPNDPNYQVTTALGDNILYYWRVDEVNDTNTWKGEVWRFRTIGLYNLTIAKCSIKAGKTQGADETDVNNIKDSFVISGTANFPPDLNGITTVDVNLISENNDELIYEQTGIAFSVVKNKFSYSHKLVKGTIGEITSMKMDFVKNTFAITAKNVDLTGIDQNDTLQLNITMGNNVVSGTANETVINGKKRAPTRLMRMFGDTLVVTKAKAKHSTKPASDSLTVTGDIAVEDINDANMNDPNLVIMDVNIVWGTDANQQTFKISADNFVAAKRGHSYKCSKIQTKDAADANNGLATAKFDLDKCTFTISIKGAEDLDIRSDYVDFGINFGTSGEVCDFNQPAEVNVVTGRSY